MSFGEESFGFTFDRACNRQSVGGLRRSSLDVALSSAAARGSRTR
jgi:hypothetical protein